MTDARTNFDLTDEQEMIRDTMRDFSESELRPGARERDEKQEFPKGPIDGLAELGMLGVCFPENVGGADGDLLSLMIAIEEMARGCGSTAATFAAHVAFCAWPIQALGTDEQKQQYLPGLCTGETLGCLAMTDPTPGAGVDGSPVIATADGDGWKLTGTKVQVVNAGEASVCVVIAREGAADGPLAAFVAGMDAAGIERSDRLATSGLRAADLRHINFTDTPASRLSNDAIDIEAALDVGRVALGAMAVGLSRAAYENAAEYSKARKQFDTPIISFAAVATRIGSIVVRTETSRHLVLHAARMADAGRTFSQEAAIAKTVASTSATESTFDAIQVFGGNGYSREYPVERLWRDARFTSLAGTVNEELRDRIVRRALEL